jgi:hypothetical protein
MGAFFCPSVLVKDPGQKEPGGCERINGSTGPSIIPGMGVTMLLCYYNKNYHENKKLGKAQF